MRKLLLAGAALALLAPAVALAQPDCAAQQQDNRVAGTVVGAGAGAVIGSAVAGPGDRGVGAVVGAVGGGLVGNAAGGAAATSCDGTPAGYYDRAGVWHEAAGYDDADGAMVDRAPSADEAGADVSAVGGPVDLGARESDLEARIHHGDATGAISRGDAEHDFDVLSGIRQYESHKRDDNGGGLSERDRADIANKLDNLTAIVRSQTER